MGIKSRVRANQRKISLCLLIIWDNSLKWKEFYSYPSKLGCSESKPIDPEQKDKINTRMIEYTTSGFALQTTAETHLRYYWSNFDPVIFYYGFNILWAVYFCLNHYSLLPEKEFFMGILQIIMVSFWLWWYTTSQEYGKQKWGQKWSTVEARV